MVHYNMCVIQYFNSIPKLNTIELKIQTQAILFEVLFSLYFWYNTRWTLRNTVKKTILETIIYVCFT